MAMTQAEEQAKKRLEETLDIIQKWKAKINSLTLEINLPPHVWQELCHMHSAMAAALQLNGR